MLNLVETHVIFIRPDHIIPIATLNTFGNKKTQNMGSCNWKTTEFDPLKAQVSNTQRMHEVRKRLCVILHQ